MSDEIVILDGLWLQEEWRCAWEAALHFAQTDGRGRSGADQSVSYDFELEGSTGELQITVWRSQSGLVVQRTQPEQEVSTWQA